MPDAPIRVTPEEAEFACAELNALKGMQPLDDYRTLGIVACVVDSINRLRRVDLDD